MRKNNKMMLFLLLIVGIGFATVATTIYLNGTATITKNSADFDVRFTKATLGSTDLTSTAITSNGQTLTYGTEDLKKVNDTSTLEFDVTNNSSLYDANVSVVCSAGAHSEYYTVTSTIDGSSSATVEAKRKKSGEVRVTLIKASTSVISETFTCTINANATERTTVGEEPLVAWMPTYFAFGDPTTSDTTDYTTLNKTVFAGLDTQGNKGVCINRSGTVSCFKANNVSYERTHVQQVFSDISCYVYSPGVECSADDFYCYVSSDGSVGCDDYSDGSGCYVDTDGSVNCS